MEQLILPAAQLGGTVFTVVIFIWYLSKRDDKWTRAIEKQGDSNVILARALQRLTDTVLKNIPAVSENTGAVTKNTEVIKKTNGKH